MKLNKLAIIEEIHKLRKVFLDELPQKIQDIVDLSVALKQTQDSDTATSLMQRFHRLAGSSASFNCDSIGQISRQAEQMLRKAVDSDEITPNLAEELSPFIEQLKTELEHLDPENVQSEFHLFEDGETRADIYILEDDRAFGLSLASRLHSFGFEAKPFTRVAELEEALEEKVPQALIVDANLTEGELAGIDVITHLTQELGLEVPIAMLTSRNDFATKLAAERAGANAFFTKPVEIDLLVAELERVIFHTSAQEQLRILIVDDDQILADYHSLLLQQHDMQCKVLNEVENVCDEIGDFNPDLILLDLYMPSCNGLELAHIIRYHPQYLHIPIVFLSTESQLDVKLDAMRMGGDDFLTKPIAPEHLTKAISIRALRARRINEMISQDSLTGLLKHTMIKERLKAEHSRSQRMGSQFSYVMIDIDNFKKVNDRFGHMVGDKVISTLARLLKNRIRSGDAVGRYGGEEFAMLLLDCNKDNARALVDLLRDDFANQNFVANGQRFNVTLSAGLVCSLDYGSPDDICRAADKALYEAKSSGKNKVVVL